MERQISLVLKVRYKKRDLVVNTHNGSVATLFGETRKQHATCPILKMSVNRVSTILGLVSLVIRK